MDIHAESETLLVLALVILVFLFLLISERRIFVRTTTAGLWGTLMIVFFSVCSLLFRGNSWITSESSDQSHPSVLVDRRQADLSK